MGDFLRLLLDSIHYLWPLRVIATYERGVLFMGGRPGIELIPTGGIFKSGIYPFLPFFMRIETLALCEDVVDLPVQSITTSDGKTVTFSANVAYVITNAVAHYTNVQDFADSFSRAACGHLALKVREWSWEELHQGQKKLEASIKGTLTTRVEDWGVKILEVRLTDCSLTRQYRLFQ